MPSGRPIIFISYAHADEPESPVEGEIKWLTFVLGFLKPYPDSMRTREKCLAFGGGSDSDGRMIRGGFLIEEDRKALIALARDGLAAGRVTRRANALVLLDKGMSCQQVAEVLLFDDDTIRGWYELFEQSGVEGL